jgi:hypothetical protein
MNRTPPEYFEPIRQAAERRWQQLEADPELAGPWHQLFKQVQSPRHVLSELLQNADDAGASEASARVVNGVFEFTHNGEDFQPDHFASLCRFGYSNKRSLHTIGFRGIGFKSTFSLGPVVAIRTSSLSVYFEKDRFTLPCWYDNQANDPNTTCILVKIQDELRQVELAKNLAEWRQSPVSLLFFRNIRRLTLEGDQLFWHSQGPGPIKDSEWYALNDSASARFLLARSEAEEFPEECIAEIKQERILGSDSDFSLPASRVELVLGASAGIYVVLPTAVKPDLPFACNGPFMQDPARVKIKDPETSPTNRWLLSRVGKLAASCMCDWLANQSLDMKSRAEAYRFLPKAGVLTDKLKVSFIVSDQQGIEGECFGEVSKSFLANIQCNRIVLAHDGSVEHSGTCIALDKQVQDIWDPETFSHELDPNGRKAICRETPAEAVNLLYRMGQIDRVNRSQVCIYLQQSNPPHPGQEKLLELWIYIAGEFTKLVQNISIEDLAIVPIADQSRLFPPRSAVRLGSSKAQLKEADIHWLAEHVLFVDRDWLVYLADQETDYVLQQGKYSSITAKEVALSLLQRMGLADGADTTKLIERIATSLGSSVDLEASACVRLGHICARLDCKVSKNFQYVTQAGEIRYVASGVCYDNTKKIESLLPHEFARQLYLSGLYAASPQSCDLDEWNSWLSTSKPALKVLPPLQQVSRQFKHAKELIDHLSDIYGKVLDPSLFPHKWERFSPAQRYSLIDYDIDNQIISYWNAQQTTEHSLSVLAQSILESSSMEWFSKPFLEIYQSNTNGLRETLVDGHGFPASWLRRFHATACISDTRGNLCKPSELLRRSEETEPLIGVERFIEKRFDHSANEIILSSLGVSSALPGPNLLLSLLGTLAAIEIPPRDEVAKLYEQLDKLYLLSKPEDQRQVLKAFQSSKLLLSEQGIWSTPINVFISADSLEGLGVPTILGSARHLSLWRQLGLRERPDAEAAIEMIRNIPLDSELAPETVELMKILMRRFTNNIIDQCCVWISLSRKLKRFDELQYALSGSAINPDSLFDEILDHCADLRFIDGYSLESLLQKAPIRELGVAISYQFEDWNNESNGASEKPQWLKTFGLCVSQLNQNPSEYTKLPSGAGEALSRAPINYVKNLRLIPMVDGKPIGRPIEKEGALVSDEIYVQKRPASRLANLIPVIIGDYLQSPQLQEAAAYSFERSDDLIIEYFQSNYGLSQAAARKSWTTASFSQVKSWSVAERDPLGIDQGDSGLPSDSSSLYSGELPETWPAGCSETHADPTESQADIPDFLKQYAAERPGDAPVATAASQEVDLLSQRIPSCDPGMPSSMGSIGVLDEQELDVRTDKKILSEVPDETRNSAQYNIVMQYAERLGLKEVGDAVFYGSNQTTLRRQRGELFPWILEGSNGLEIKRFLVRTSPIVASPLELDTVAFGLLERLPDGHSILIPDTTGNPTEISGSELQAMIADGRLKIFPSSYRLALV